MILGIKNEIEKIEDIVNVFKCLGAKDDFEYFIKQRRLESNSYSTLIDEYIYMEEDNELYVLCGNDDEELIYMTYDEFHEKYPYTVGDKVIYIKYGDNTPHIITQMKWTGTTVEYTLDNSLECLKKDLKPCLYLTKEEVKEIFIVKPEDNMLKTINLKDCDLDEIELELGDYEIINRDGKTYAVRKKPSYPISYTQCCRMLGEREEDNYTTGYKSQLFTDLHDLYICRDAYWKLAGDILKLDKPWEPDYTNSRPESLYAIYTVSNEVRKQQLYVNKNTLLVFPTEEMCEVFYENFKPLIEKCKHFL